LLGLAPTFRRPPGHGHRLRPRRNESFDESSTPPPPDESFDESSTPSRDESFDESSRRSSRRRVGTALVAPYAHDE
jgi:hypothetical protein